MLTSVASAAVAEVVATWSGPGYTATGSRSRPTLDRGELPTPEAAATPEDKEERS